MAGFMCLLVALAQADISPVEAERARDLEREAHQLQAQGKFVEAQKPLSEAIALWTKHYGADHIDVLNDEMNLAVAYRRAGNLGKAIELLESVAERLKASRDQDALQLRHQALNSLAVTYHEAGQLDDAKSAMLEGLETIRPTGAGAVKARMLSNLSSLLLDFPQPDLIEAGRYAEQALNEWKTLRGEEDGEVASSTLTLATIRLRQGDLIGARPLIERAVQLMKKSKGETHPDVALALYALGELEHRSDRRAEAKAAYEAGLAISKQHFDAAHPQVKEGVAGLASLGPEPRVWPWVVGVAVVLVMAGACAMARRKRS